MLSFQARFIQRLNVFALILFLFSVSAILSAADWPQWRGPNRDGKSPETGLLKSWPDGGPPVVWKTTGLGKGFSSPAIVGEQIFILGSRGENTLLFCLDRLDGSEQWTVTLGDLYYNNFGDGPRSTPTIDGDRVYALSGQGDLVAVKRADGSLIWRLNILEQFGGRNIRWGISESPLIDGDRLLVTPGGEDAMVVGLDKMTGETVWTSQGLADQPGYASLVLNTVEGRRILATLTSNHGIGVDADSGEILWTYPAPANRTANITTPIFHEDAVFYTTAYGTGGGLLDVDVEDGEVRTNEVYFNRNMQNHHGGVVLVGDYIYGFSDSILACLDFSTGELMWRDRSVGKGSLIHADGHLYLVGERGEVGLAEATPEGYREKGRFRLPDEGVQVWAHPAVSGGNLFIRNGPTLTCFDIREKQS